MAGKIPKPSDVDAANIARPTFQQLSTEHQKALDDIQMKIRQEKEIERLEEEATKQYISYFSIDRQGKVTKDVAFDASQFEVKFDEDKHSALNSEIANAIDNVVASHVNNNLDFMVQNIHSMFDDCFSQIETHFGMKSIGNDKHAPTSNTDKTRLIPTTTAIVTDSANQHGRINYNSSSNANAPYHCNIFLHR